MNTIPALFGPYGSAAVEFIDQFERYGANALWFHGFDPTAFEACQKHQLSACVELKTFRADFASHPELIPIGADGHPIRYGELVQGVCLSQTAFLEEIEADLIDALRQYAPAGIWLDYLTYAGWFEVPEPDLQESCFCPACIADFCESTGLDATSPDEILGTAAAQWEQHKCQRIAGFARRYADLIHAHLPECIVGAYMCPWQPHEFDRASTRIFAQDYTLLAPAIDVFTPLIYCAKSGRGPAWGREFLEASPAFIPHDRPVQLILDALDFPASLHETAASTHPSWGLQIFSGAQVFRDPQPALEFAAAVEQIREAQTGSSRPS
ncbi:hypothetical protein [Actinopolymorpha alba]|uniref:hypothetical protein n=1 Tax=Actinopolymorpha alba TaxID=533267 RepID=UPI00037959BA|nr:hypothetical protein [Actinopolymorpha alba]